MALTLTCSLVNIPGVLMMKMLSVAACELAADAGPCHDYTDKWFYNVQSKSCEIFSYGGCEGNDNRFSSQAECERTCLRQRKLQQQGNVQAIRYLVNNFSTCIAKLGDILETFFIFVITAGSVNWLMSQSSPHARLKMYLNYVCQRRPVALTCRSACPGSHMVKHYTRCHCQTSSFIN